MGPCVTSNLVAFLRHALAGPVSVNHSTAPLPGTYLDESRPRQIRVIDHAFPDIVSSDEEGSFGAVRSEFVKEVARVLVWPVVKSQRNVAFVRAIVDPQPAVGDLAELRSSNIDSRYSRR